MLGVQISLRPFMGFSIVNETEEQIVIEPGDELKLGFNGDYEVEEEKSRVMATRSRVMRIVGSTENEETPEKAMELTEKSDS